jgi:hypothetical protein
LSAVLCAAIAGYFFVVVVVVDWKRVNSRFAKAVKKMVSPVTAGIFIGFEF